MLQIFDFDVIAHRDAHFGILIESSENSGVLEMVVDRIQQVLEVPPIIFFFLLEAIRQAYEVPIIIIYLEDNIALAQLA